MRHTDLIVVHRQEVGLTGAEVAQNEPGAYHLAVFRDGHIEWALSAGGFDLGFELKGAHATNWNAHSIGLAVYGCFDEEPEGKPLPFKPHNMHPTQAQLDTLELLCRGLEFWLGRKLYLNGHTELKGATRFPGKRCPGRYLDMDALRARTGLLPHPDAR